jgi:hypothetical protein
MEWILIVLRIWDVNTPQIREGTTATDPDVDVMVFIEVENTGSIEAQTVVGKMVKHDVVKMETTSRGNIKPGVQSCGRKSND